MLLSVLCFGITTLVSLVSAHTQIWYPQWRADSFDLPFSQTIYPCAGIFDNSTTPRTLWPLTGGSLNVTLHDAAAYIFINLGFGVNSSDFNVTLFSAPLNETGPGNLCFPKLTLPPGLPIEEGTQASIQFATTGHNGEGLYNCADITFTNNATLLPADQCQNSSTVSVTTLGSCSSPATNSSSASSSTTAASSSAADGLAPSALMVLLASLFLVVW